MPARAIERDSAERVNWVTSIPFVLVHLLCLTALITGVTTEAIILGVVLYFGRMWFITAGYHRYFSHRSFKTNRAFQFVLAFGGATAAQKGPLWWASHHREHHRYSDTEDDLHSPLKGFWWSHLGWILSDKNNGWDERQIKDFAKYPELRFLNDHDWIAPWSLGIVSFLIAGWPGLVVGFLWSTVLLWHGTFTVNSLAHVMGQRRYATTDTSRNSILIALWANGEGWHNNHHYYQASARNGFFWWEWDPTYYGLKVLSWFRIVTDLKTPPAKVRATGRVRDGQFDIGIFRAHWAKASAALADARGLGGLPSESEGDDPRVESATTHARTDGATGVSADSVDIAGGTETGDGEPSRRGQLEERVQASRASLESYVASTLQSADELGRLSRRHQRATAD